MIRKNLFVLKNFCKGRKYFANTVSKCKIPKRLPCPACRKKLSVHALRIHNSGDIMFAILPIKRFHPERFFHSSGVIPTERILSS
jgi:hypothetical protein